jgi:hypothetical protein
MTARHLEFLVEEPSMEAFLQKFLPRVLGEETFLIHAFQGKRDLLGKLRSRLAGYAGWLPRDWRIVVVVDRDGEDCYALKQELEVAAKSAGLVTRSCAEGRSWQLVTRLAIEELEAWYFGDWEGVRNAYPRLSRSVSLKKEFRDPDAIQGGTWEAFERVLQKHRYFETGLRKIEAARTLGALIEPEQNRSPSFRVFYEVIVEARDGESS